MDTFTPTEPPVLSAIPRPLLPDAAKLYQVPLDILLQAVHTSLTPRVRAQVQAQFGAYLGKSSYPILIGNELVDFLAANCLADQSQAAARRLIGRYYLLRFRESILGRVMLATLPMMGWERALRRVPKDMAAVTNYGTRWVRVRGPQHWQVGCEDELIYPEMLLGTFEAMSEVVRVPGLQITYTLPQPKHLLFDFRW